MELVSAHPFSVDLMLALCISLVMIVFEAVDGGDVGAGLDAVDVVAAGIASAIIVLRRFAPVPILMLALGAGLWSFMLEDDQPILRVATFLALYTVASISNRRLAWTAGVTVTLAMYITSWVTSQSHWFDSENLQQIAWMMVATSLGEAVRSRKAYVLARNERAEVIRVQAARELDEQMRWQVIEERLRIARELHDVVAHHMAVVNVQAGVASHLITRDPAGAEEALAHVRHGARSVLDELGEVLSVMRRTGDVADQASSLPTLDELDQLVQGTRAAGLELNWEVIGIPRQLSPTVSFTAYRIIQESLTNALRHGMDGRANLRLEYTRDTLVIEITNAVRSGISGSGKPGHGHVGMSERAAAINGTIQIGPRGDGTYRVRATLPCEGSDV